MIITITIHKGGTGKTTIAVNLARFASEKGKRVLLVDLDTQGNATDNFDFDKTDLSEYETSANLFIADNQKRIITVTSNLDIIPANSNLLAIERFPVESANTFKTCLRRYAKDYDLVVIDTPPTMGFGMLAPLVACDYALAPIVPDAYSIKGVSSLIRRIKEIQSNQNPDLKFLGLLINQLDRRSQAQLKVVDALKIIGGNLIPYAIGVHVAVGYSAHARQAVWHGARNGAHRKAGKAVKSALDWILNRMEEGHDGKGIQRD